MPRAPHSPTTRSHWSQSPEREIHGVFDGSILIGMHTVAAYLFAEQLT